MRPRAARAALAAALALGLPVVDTMALAATGLRLDDEPGAAAARPRPDPAAAVTLAHVLREAAGQDNALRQAGAARDQAQAALDLAQRRRLPEASVSVAVQRQGDGNTRATTQSATAGLSYTVLDFGAGRAEVEQARQERDAAEAARRAARLAATSEAVRRYAEAAIAQDRLATQTETRRNAEQTLRVAETRAAGGAGVPTDLLQARTALAQATVELNRARAGWLAARGALAVLLGRGADDALELVPPSDAELVADDDLLDLGLLQKEAQAQHPRILAAQARVAAARARQDGVQAASRGALVLQANGGPARVKGDVAVASTTQSLGLQWTMPIFDGASTDARRRDALAGLEAERAALDEARRQVDLELWQQAQALRGERDNLQAVDLALQTAREALRVASARYREGIGSFPDLLATQNALAATQGQRQQARASLLLARVRLAAAVGRLLPG